MRTPEGIFKVVINLTFRRTVGPPTRIAAHLVQVADQELSMTLAAERELRRPRKGFPGRKTLALKPELRDSTRCVAVLGGGGHNLHLLLHLEWMSAWAMCSEAFIDEFQVGLGSDGLTEAAV